ncbi:SNF2 family amino-terminal protein [Sesbania bispinosa]|nr:SNF2 family amino-terminal protein [Sesbania bispinosa]
MTKVEPSDGLPVKIGEMTNFNALPNSSQMENISTLSGNMRTMLRENQKGAYDEVDGGMAVPASVSPMAEPVSQVQFNMVVHLSVMREVRIGRHNSGLEITMLRQGVPPRDTGKSSAPSPPASSAMPFKEQQ